MRRILVITDLELTEVFFRKHFREDYEVSVYFNKESAISENSKKKFDFIFIDLLLLKKFNTKTVSFSDLKKLISPISTNFPSAKIIIMTEPQNTNESVLAVRAGFHNYLTYPLVVEEVNFLIEKEYENTVHRGELAYLKDEYWRGLPTYVLETKSSKMAKVLEKIRAVATTKSTVLLLGETGTGKSVFAKIIHQKSNRRQDRFISVHCGSISENLIESELFGHEKGSFTGAHRTKLGKFEIANEGTIFLDEVGTVSAQIQISLLQVLQEKFIQRVGGEEEIPVDVRIVSASNIDLKTLVQEKAFREDLYYRLNVFPIEIPPLRERIEDIPFFVDTFIEKLNKSLIKDIGGISNEVLEAFSRYEWPGNIRELENLLERAYILEKTNKLTPDSFPSELFDKVDMPTATIPYHPTMPLADARKIAMESFERSYVLELLQLNLGKINKSAEMANITTRQLHKLITKHGINRKEFVSTK